jgi:hypothetical protein
MRFHFFTLRPSNHLLLIENKQQRSQVPCCERIAFHG